MQVVLVQVRLYEVWGDMRYAELVVKYECYWFLVGGDQGCRGRQVHQSGVAGNPVQGGAGLVRGGGGLW